MKTLTFKSLLIATAVGNVFFARCAQDDSMTASPGGGKQSEESVVPADPQALTAAELASLPLKSVILLRVDRPSCRYGEPAGTVVPHICTGTVISDRHVLTAAHCFVSDCPSATGMVPVKISGVKIPSVPTSIMTGFNWNDATKVISPKNIAVKSGPTGFTGQSLRNKTSGVAVPSFMYGLTSNDVAVMDFGVGVLSKAGYPAAPVKDAATSNTFDALNSLFIPVAYTIPNSKNLELSARNSRKADILPYLLGNFPSPRIAFTASSKDLSLYDVGCWGG